MLCALRFLVLLLLLLLGPASVSAREPKDAGIPARAKQRVAEATRYEESARRSLAKGDLKRAESQGRTGQALSS